MITTTDPSAGPGDAHELPVDGASSCEDLVADPLFDQQAVVVFAVHTAEGSTDDRNCTLAVAPGATALDVLGLNRSCAAGMSVAVAVARESSGVWRVDREETGRLGVEGCVPAR
jgi:hypothetical protein